MLFYIKIFFLFVQVKNLPLPMIAAISSSEPVIHPLPIIHPAWLHSSPHMEEMLPLLPTTLLPTWFHFTNPNPLRYRAITFPTHSIGATMTMLTWFKVGYRLIFFEFKIKNIRPILKFNIC